MYLYRNEKLTVMQCWECNSLTNTEWSYRINKSAINWAIEGARMPVTTDRSLQRM